MALRSAGVTTAHPGRAYPTGERFDRHQQWHPAYLRAARGQHGGVLGIQPQNGRILAPCGRIDAVYDSGAVHTCAVRQDGAADLLGTMRRSASSLHHPRGSGSPPSATGTPTHAVEITRHPGLLGLGRLLAAGRRTTDSWQSTTDGATTAACARTARSGVGDGISIGNPRSIPENARLAISVGVTPSVRTEGRRLRGVLGRAGSRRRSHPPRHERFVSVQRATAVAREDGSILCWGENVQWAVLARGSGTNLACSAMRAIYAGVCPAPRAPDGASRLGRRPASPTGLAAGAAAPLAAGQRRRRGGATARPRDAREVCWSIRFSIKATSATRG